MFNHLTFRNAHSFINSITVKHPFESSFSLISGYLLMWCFVPLMCYLRNQKSLVLDAGSKALPAAKIEQANMPVYKFDHI